MLCKNMRAAREKERKEGTPIMFLLTESAAASGTSSIIMLVFYVVIIGAAMYFMAIRPQKKEQKRINAMLSELAVGDSVVTTSGFYGVVIDLTDEDVIVEFGSNKNCRIPMRKSAIAEVEKADAQ